MNVADSKQMVLGTKPEHIMRFLCEHLLGLRTMPERGEKKREKKLVSNTTLRDFVFHVGSRLLSTFSINNIYFPTTCAMSMPRVFLYND